LRLHYKDQPVNAAWGNTLFFSNNYIEHRNYTILANSETLRCCNSLYCFWKYH